MTNPTHIRLSNKSFDNGAAAKIAQYLESLEGVIVADVSDIIAGRPEDEALRTLNIICSSLKKFDLVEVNLSDNALGAKGVEECKTILLGDNIQVHILCCLSLKHVILISSHTLFVFLLYRDYMCATTVSPPRLRSFWRRS